MTIFLRHAWLVEHNLKINWCIGKVSMTRCPALCGSDTTSDRTNQLTLSSANDLADPPRTKSCCRDHIEEVLEDMPESTETDPPPGFMCTNPDEMT